MSTLFWHRSPSPTAVPPTPFWQLYEEHGVDGQPAHGGCRHGGAGDPFHPGPGADRKGRADGRGHRGDLAAGPARDLRRKLRIDVPGTGIAFTVPLSSIGGKRALQFLTEHQTLALKEESTLKDTRYELLLVIANQGHTGSIMDAARAAGAGGGTVIHAKGHRHGGCRPLSGRGAGEREGAGAHRGPHHPEKPAS